MNTLRGHARPRPIAAMFSVPIQGIWEQIVGSADKHSYSIGMPPRPILAQPELRPRFS